MWRCCLCHLGLPPRKQQKIFVVTTRKKSQTACFRLIYWCRMCVEPVASGYSNSPCLIAGGHLSATSGSAQASCKAWAPTSVKGALEVACAEPCSSLVRCSRWLQAEMTSAMVQCLSGQELVSEFEPSFLKEGQMLKNNWSPKHIRTNPRINSIHNNQMSSQRLFSSLSCPRKYVAHWRASKHLHQVFSPKYLPPGLMTMAPLLRVSSSTCAMLSLAFW